MSAPLFFAEWKPPGGKIEGKYDNFKQQVGVIALNDDLTHAAILYKREMIKVPLSELVWVRWE